MTNIRIHALRCLIATVALAATAPLAIAQMDSTTQSTLPAGSSAAQTGVGRSRTGAPIEQVQITSPVRYRDLNLATLEGQAELTQRIHRVAQQACYQLRTQTGGSASSIGGYPVPTQAWTAPECVRTAVRSTIAKVRQRLAQRGQVWR
jgi:UrcA family protein